jgi:DNA end-binding protein Ku
VLETIYYADEVRRPEKVNGGGQLRKPEVELAKSLVENLSAKFDPAKYDDTYRKELLDLLKAKDKGQELPEPEEPQGEVVDLMQALRDSVERTQKTRKRSRAKKTA